MSIQSRNPAMKKVERMVDRVAETDLTVLITGETGVGKGVLARQIASRSQRSEQPFIKINSAAIPATLLESELYGHQKGAFTGAVAERRGRVQDAHRGTLFFDEIGELDLQTQSKLLHMIQDREFSSLGSNRTTRVDVRLIAATNRNLKQAVDEGLFRQDLFYRINEIHIPLPPLKERKEDIPVLTEYFIERAQEQFNKKSETVLNPTQQRVLLEYHWPGNIRELENFINNLVLLGDAQNALRRLEGRIRRPERDTAEDLSLTDLVKQVEQKVERTVIERTLERNGWNRKITASMLNISYRSLLSKIKRFELAR